MADAPVQFVLGSLEETRRLADAVRKASTLPLTIALNGSLGAGKTQWVRFLAELLGANPSDVTSPTYVLLQKYRGQADLYHFDFYRLETVDQVWDLGFDELEAVNAWVVVEWADKFPECMPDDHLTIEIATSEMGQRVATVTASGQVSQAVLTALPPEL